MERYENGTSLRLGRTVMAGSGIFTLLLLFLFLFLLSAFFAAAEMAYSSINKIRMKRFVEEGRTGAGRAMLLLQDFSRTISTILVGGNIVDIIMTAIASTVLALLFGPIGALYATVLMTVLIILFGEVLPKSYVKDCSESFALGAAPVLRFFVRLLHPLTWCIMSFSAFLGRWRSAGQRPQPSVTHDELLHILETMGEEQVLPQAERELIENAVNFNELEVWEIQTPRVDVFALDVDEEPQRVRALLVKNQYSRVPVYEGTLDNIIGVLHVKDYMRRVFQQEETNLRSVIKRPVLLAGSASLMDALRIFRANRTHMAIVLDEYGGTSGILTVEDILEELVGEIRDEHDDIKESFTQLEENVYLVSGDVYLEDIFYEHLNLDTMPDSEASTLSGWLYEQFKTLPEQGAAVAWGGFLFSVAKVGGQRILKVRIERKPVEEAIPSLPHQE
jgi:putative hemolysin